MTTHANQTGIDEAVEYYENFDLDKICTLVKVDALVSTLSQAGYDPEKIKLLHEGFTQGFDLCYEGPKNRQSNSENIPLNVGTKTQLWNKIMKEV